MKKTIATLFAAAALTAPVTFAATPHSASGFSDSERTVKRLVLETTVDSVNNTTATKHYSYNTDGNLKSMTLDGEYTMEIDWTNYDRGEVVIDYTGIDGESRRAVFGSFIEDLPHNVKIIRGDSVLLNKTITYNSKYLDSIFDDIRPEAQPVVESEFSAAEPKLVIFDRTYSAISGNSIRYSNSPQRERMYYRYHATPNYGGIYYMFIPTCFVELGFAADAGLLGTAPSTMPVTVISDVWDDTIDAEQVNAVRYHWTVDDDGYPASVYTGDGSVVTTFVWETAN